MEMILEKQIYLMSNLG